MAETISNEITTRALRSGGASAGAIYAMVARTLTRRKISGENAIDLGCGSGALKEVASRHCRRYVGADAVRYEHFPSDCQFIETDLNKTPFPFEGGKADLVLAIETIEHLENPRSLLSEMTRIARPGGWIMVSTPNQLSFLSLVTLVCKRRFSAFQDSHYPAHITALLETDLVNIAREVGLKDIAIEYSEEGRIILTPLKYPHFISRMLPRLCSDNILLVGRAP